MSRARVALLVAAAALLVLDGPAASPGTPLPPGDMAHASDGPPDAAAIAARVGRLNPHLTGSERLRIGEAVLRYSAKYELDPILVTAVIEVESSARPWARSPKGALGLMQVMPYMMRPMRVAGNASTIETNIEAGCLILAGNIQRLGEEDGISAYFWGSQIRGVSYLNRVQAARDRVADELRS